MLLLLLLQIKVEIVKVDESGEEIVKETTFRRELLTRCQKEFEKDKRDDETKEEMLKALEEAAPVSNDAPPTDTPILIKLILNII